MNDYRKKVPAPRVISAREAVTQYGDDWRLIGRTIYPWRDRMTPHDFDATAMKMMERGEMGRA